jgi:hypothetical protein
LVMHHPAGFRALSRRNGAIVGSARRSRGTGRTCGSLRHDPDAGVYPRTADPVRQDVCLQGAHTGPAS